MTEEKMEQPAGVTQAVQVNEKVQTKSQKVKLYILLHLLLMMFSAMGICSKIAANQEFMSPKFIFYYGLMLAILAIYAFAWQQVIKRLSLTTAFANKAVIVVWGMIWGVVAFQEHISVGKIVGSIIIIVGIVLFSMAEKPSGVNFTVVEEQEEQKMAGQKSIKQTKEDE